jgi:hypothetical protein
LVNPAPEPLCHLVQKNQTRSPPLKKVAKSLRLHRPLILYWFVALSAISARVVEGFNGKTKLTTRKVYRLRTPQGIAFAFPRSGFKTVAA